MDLCINCGSKSVTKQRITRKHIGFLCHKCGMMWEKWV